MASSVKYHKTYLKLHGEYETYAYPLIKKALDEQMAVVTNFTDETNFDDVQIYVQFLVNQAPMYDALEKIYKKVGVSAATFSYDWIRNSVPKSRKDFILDFFNPEWSAEMVEYFRLIGGNKIAGIDQTTIDRIKSVLADILSQNLSRREQAKLFEETLNDPAFNRARALVIARTESTTAANYGINLGAESSDYEVEKFWINTKDKRTRRTHLMMTQDPIAINQPFLVGGVPMMYPGDPSAPAAEVVNCRCVMSTKAQLDSDGLPILKPRTPPYLRGSSQATLPKPVIQDVEPKTIIQAKLKSVDIFSNNTNVKISDVEVDDKLSLKELNEKINQLEKLTKEYNISDGYLNTESVKLLYKSDKKLYGFVTSRNDGKQLTQINLGSDLDKDRINFNPNGGYLRDVSKIDDDKLNISTPTHEFGHLISVTNHRLINDKHKQFWIEIENLNRIYSNEINQLRSNYSQNKEKLNEIYLGRYANTNYNEFMAEGFTEYKLSSNPSKYAIEIGKLIDKYFKK